MKSLFHRDTLKSKSTTISIPPPTAINTSGHSIESSAKRHPNDIKMSSTTPRKFLSKISNILGNTFHGNSLSRKSSSRSSIGPSESSGYIDGKSPADVKGTAATVPSSGQYRRTVKSVQPSAYPSSDTISPKSNPYRNSREIGIGPTDAVAERSTSPRRLESKIFKPTEFDHFSDVRSTEKEESDNYAVARPSVTVTRGSSTNMKSSAKSNKDKALCCDKCDGKHATDDCPYYKKPREAHPDAQRGKKMGGTSSLPGAILRSARIVRQPGDGSCLFHSMSYGLRNGLTAERLRYDLCQYIKHNPSLKISDTPLSDWVKWDSKLSCADYARRMASGTWGGGIEMACTSLMYRCNVHVYERSVEGFKRISAFDYPENPELYPVVRVLYCGGIHYGK